MTNATMPEMVLTLGHSNHPIDRFIELLRDQQVTTAIDVRSRPFSRLYPAFNRPALARSLVEHGIDYTFMGDELGGRSDDRSCYKDGRVDYQTLAQTVSFKAGLSHVIQASQSAHVALVCAEKEPLACHRALLIGRALEEAGTPVAHLGAGGELEPHADAMTRLLRKLRMPDADLFRTREQIIEDAIEKQSRRVAYTDERMDVTSVEKHGEATHHRLY